MKNLSLKPNFHDLIRLEKEVPTGKRRIHSQIVSDILNKCVNPQNKTNIMYGSNLSYKMLTEYLSELTDAGLLETSVFSEAKYFITTKGKEYLKKYRELQEIADL